MYGKIFASLYQGTLRGRSNEILVFTNMLAHAARDGSVDKHWRAISEETGLSIDEVKEAIDTLEAPDPESRSPEEEGRRLVRLDEHRAWGWRIVNHSKYRAIRSEEDRAEQNRLAQARWRERNKSKPASAEGKTDKPMQKQRQEAETDAKAETLSPTTSPQTGSAVASRGVTESKNSDSIPTTDQSKRIATIFHRKLTTPWNTKEIKAYKTIGTLAPEDLEALEAYYGANWPPRRDVNVLRHDLSTFLNNITGEIDRAHAWKAAKSVRGKNGTLPPEDMPPIIDP